MHIFLTGGTGFFGRALLRHWMIQESIGATVPVVTVLSRTPDFFLKRNPEFSQLPWLKLVEGDIGAPETLPLNLSFTHILHAAADSTLGPQLTPLQRYDQIVNGTRNMLDFALRCKVQRFLLTSSGAVYGAQPPHLDRLPEGWHGMPDPLNAAHAYGVAKRAAEHLCGLYSDAFGLHTVLARCFAFVGPDLSLNTHFAIGNFIRDALWGDDITVSGDGTPLRSFLDQRDLAHWLITLLLHGQFAQAYNVGSDHVISIADLAHLVRDTLAPDKAVRLLGQPMPNGSRNLYVPDIQKAQDDFSLKVTIPLRDSIVIAATEAKRRGLQAS
jgi:UDP-glucuronate decarboxylase